MKTKLEILELIGNELEILNRFCLVKVSSSQRGEVRLKIWQRFEKNKLYGLWFTINNKNNLHIFKMSTPSSGRSRLYTKSHKYDIGPPSTEKIVKVFELFSTSSIEHAVNTINDVPDRKFKSELLQSIEEELKTYNIFDDLELWGQDSNKPGLRVTAEVGDKKNIKCKLWLKINNHKKLYIKGEKTYFDDEEGHHTDFNILGSGTNNKYCIGTPSAEKIVGLFRIYDEETNHDIKKAIDAMKNYASNIKSARTNL